jgi:hypothetical protein
LLDDPPDAAAAATAAADEPPPAAAALPEALVDELLEQAVKLSRHRPAPAATTGMYWRIDRVVMRTPKQPAVTAE